MVPVAEEAGVKLAMHPDDPPRSPIRGIGRIMTSPENFQRMLDLVDSSANGLTFCQGCFTEMNIDVPKWIRHFAGMGKMHFAHYRNINKGGSADHFSETFHDEEGEADMYEAMKAYIESGFSGPMRPDHAPTMEGEGNDHPGYALQGRLMAVGYMKGLMEAEGLPYGKRTHTYNSRLAQELGKWADTQEGGYGIHDALYRAYFVDARNIGDIDVLMDVVRAVGLPEEAAREVLMETH